MDSQIAEETLSTSDGRATRIHPSCPPRHSDPSKSQLPLVEPSGGPSQDKEECGRPCQQNNHHHHHHHHHHYHHPTCCSPASALSSPSPSLQSNAEYPSHTHKYPSHKHTHIGSLSCTCIARILPPASLICIEHTENAHKLAPSISPFRESTHILPINEIHLYAEAPSLPSKRPRTTVFPPLPCPSSPPYVLCQHCFQLLALPLHRVSHSSVFKLKCSLCMTVSLFSTRHQHALPSSGAAISDKGKLRCKGGAKHRSEDEPTIVSSKDGVSKLNSDQGVVKVNENVFLLSDGEIQQETEEGEIHDHLGIIDALTVVQTSMSPSTTAIDVSKGEPPLVEDDVKVADADMPIGDTRGDASVCEEPPPKLNPEFAGFSSVQDWVNSLEHGGFSYCPTPLIGAGTGFGSDLLVQNALVVHPVPGSPLHEHFGYKSARQLLKKTLSSDDEIRAHSDTNSSTSTSIASANTFKPPGFDTGGPPSRTSLQHLAKSHVKSSIHVEQEDGISLAKLLKRNFKGFGERKSLSVSNSKSRVVVNGHALSELAIKRAEELAGSLLPGIYWYDRMAGFWGIVGGPCLGVLPPFIEELHYPMARNCSNGDTNVFVNGRELHLKDLALLSHRGLSRKPGRAYVLGFDGVVTEEASGQELVHLGKLAPTVEKRGKGFGMYMEKPR